MTCVPTPNVEHNTIIKLLGNTYIEMFWPFSYNIYEYFVGLFAD
jgi:hypothetical protein